jgi:hypothetical protein
MRIDCALARLTVTAGNSWSVNAASWVTATGVIVALIIGTGTVVQRRYSDRAAHWSSRTQWALDLSLESDDDAKVEVGAEVLTYILGSRITSREQGRFIRIAASRILDQREAVDVDGEGDD